LQLGAGQSIEGHAQARVLLNLMLPDDQALARTPGQQGNPGMHPQNLEHLPGARKESRGHEDEPERYVRRCQLGAQTLRPLLEARLVEVARPVRCRGILIAHKANLAGKAPNANPKTEDRRPKEARSPKSEEGVSQLVAALSRLALDLG